MANCNPGTRQYIGARYIPRHMGEWCADTQYSALDVVLYTDGNSYTAKCYPPKGTIPTDDKYWSLSAQFNQQLTLVQEQTENTQNSLNTLKNNLSFFVTDFECDDGQKVQGNGVHDDTSGIQAALDYIESTCTLNVLDADWNYGGAELIFPKGVYIITDNIYIPQCVSIRGESVFSTVIACSTSKQVTNKKKTEVAGNRSVSVRDITLKGAQLYLIQPYNSFVENVRVFDSDGVLIQLSVNTILNNVFCYNCSTGLAISGQAGSGSATTVFATNLWIAHCRTGFNINGQKNFIQNVFIKNIIVEYCDKAGYIYQGSKQNNNIVIDGLHYEQNKNYISVNSDCTIRNAFSDDTSVLNLVVETGNEGASVYIYDSVMNVLAQASDKNILGFYNLLPVKVFNINNTVENGKRTHKQSDGTNICQNTYKIFAEKDHDAAVNTVFDVLITGSGGKFYIGKLNWIGSVFTIAKIAGNIDATVDAGTVKASESLTGAAYYLSF